MEGFRGPVALSIMLLCGFQRSFQALILSLVAHLVDIGLSLRGKAQDMGKGEGV